MCFDLLGRARRVRGPDRLVSLLRAFLRTERAWFGWNVLFAVALTDDAADFLHRRGREVNGVGPHIRDEADLALGPQLHSFVELLCDDHRPPSGETELACGLLLERRRDERSR